MSLIAELESEMREVMASRETSPVALMIKEALARHRMSRAQLAADARISLSALEKGLSGQRSFSDSAVIRIEEVLGISLRAPAVASAPDELGGYARASVSWLEGHYLTIRPANRKQGGLFTYTTIVSWEAAQACLVFEERARLDAAYAQKGHVAVPHQTGHIYFTTNRHGQNRLMIVKRKTVTGEMFGLLLTLQQERGAALMPVTMPVALVPLTQLKDPPSLGLISEQHKAHDDYAMKLRTVEAEGFAQVMKMREW